MPPASGTPLCLGWASEACWVRCACLPRAVCFLAQGQSVYLMASQAACYRTVAVVRMGGLGGPVLLQVITWSLGVLGLVEIISPFERLLRAKHFTDAS